MKNVGLWSHGCWHFSYWYFYSHSLQEMSLMVVRGVGWYDWSQRFARWRQCWWCNNLNKNRHSITTRRLKKVKSEIHNYVGLVHHIILGRPAKSLTSIMYYSLNPPQMNNALSEEIIKFSHRSLSSKFSYSRYSPASIWYNFSIKNSLSINKWSLWFGTIL